MALNGGPTLLALPEELLSMICTAYFDYEWSVTLESHNYDKSSFQSRFARIWSRQFDSINHRSTLSGVPSLDLLLVNKKVSRIAKDALRKTFGALLTIAERREDEESQYFSHCQAGTLIAWIRDNICMIKAEGPASLEYPSGSREAQR
ncbi:hypothetical protein PMZ80_009206 [Knufia obscura]|uniref:Uncharacterized protein n=1 Tax=Knufia obscura TaxID=1635080 RepID=A0ABR0RC75_9EURO|nr:hypothetical protein PMZ80_009206 [Knufia obscura]